MGEPCTQCGERPAAHRYRRCTRCRRKPYPPGTYGRGSRNGRDPAKLPVYARTGLLRSYGLTQATYDEMLLAQDGRCAICRKAVDYTLSVDHDHVTGAVRGLLCVPCNSGIGQLGDDPERLRAAIDYLVRCSTKAPISG